MRRLVVGMLVLCALFSGVSSAHASEVIPSYLIADWVARTEMYMNNGGAVTVNGVAARTGLTAGQVTSASNRIASLLKQHGVKVGENGVTQATFGGLVSSLLVGTAVQYGGSYLINGLVGRTYFYKADGTQVGSSDVWDSFGQFAHMKAMASGEPIYEFHTDSWLFAQEIDPHIAWVFAEYEVPHEDGGYSFNGVVAYYPTYLQTTTDPFYEGVSGTFTTLPSQIFNDPMTSFGSEAYPWGPNQEWVAGLASDLYGRADVPIVPVWSTTATPGRMTLTGFLNRVNGDLLTTSLPTTHQFRPIIFGGGQIYASGSTREADLGNTISWYDAEWNLIASQLSDSVTVVNPLDTGVLLPQTAPQSYLLDGEVLDELTDNPTIGDYLGAVTVPNALPWKVIENVPSIAPMEDVLTDVETPDSDTQDTIVPAFLLRFWANAGQLIRNIFTMSNDTVLESVTPAIASVQVQAADKWPFAGAAAVGLVSDSVESGAFDDPMEWYVDVTPDGDSSGDEQSVGSAAGSLAGVPQTHAGVWIRPLTWLDPIKRFRWVLVGGVWAMFLWGLSALLSPKVHV